MSTSVVHLRDIAKRTGFFTVWEKQRNSRFHWLMELFAESLGVFFYTYAGVGSTAPWVLGNITKVTGISSLLQIGFAYAFGILIAIGVCSATSGGHFNPCVTIAFVVFKGFPPLKAVRYIAAQILGGYIACLLVYAQYKDLIIAVEEALAAKGALSAIQFTQAGPAGIFALYLPHGVTIGRVFLNEFVTDTFIALAIWGAIDPTNALIPPVAAPWVVSFAYAVAIWGFAAPGLAANSARDVGGRLAALTIYGMEASGGRYAALAALTNIPATLFAAFLYEIFLTDSDRVVPGPNLDYLAGHKNHLRVHIANGSDSVSSVTHGKAYVEALEHSHA